METNLKLQRTTLIDNEQDKLHSTNKMHNFTTVSLPSDTIALLNKGTSFIATTTTPSTYSKHYVH